jgi:hypothetical protein
MDDEPWHARRLRELEAATPPKRKKQEPFVKVPLWWADGGDSHEKSARRHRAASHSLEDETDDIPATERAIGQARG